MTTTRGIPTRESRGTAGVGSRIFTVGTIVLAALVFVLVVYPLLSTFIREIFPDGVFNGGAFVAVFGSWPFWLATINTVIVLVVSGLLALIIGIAFAWLNERTDARMGFFSKAMPVLPLLIPSIAMSIGWVFLAQKTSGFLNVPLRVIAGWFGQHLTQGPLDISTWPGLVFVYVLSLVPYSYLIVSSAFRNLDPSLEEAARVGGAGKFRVFLRISTGSILPSIVSAGLVEMIYGLGLFSVPTIIGTPAKIDVLSVMTVRLIRGTYPPKIDQGVVVSLLMTVLIAILFILERRVSRGQRHATISGKAGGSSLIELGAWRWVARVAVFVFLIFSTVLPFLALVVVSLQPFWTPTISFSHLGFTNFVALFQGGFAARSIINSVVLGAVGATIAMLVASVIVEFARSRPGWLGTSAMGVVRLPGAITHIVLGIGFLVVIGGRPFNLNGTTLLLLIGYVIAYLPQAATTAGSAISQISPELIEAGRMSGANLGRVFGRITLPLMLPGLAAGWATVFVVIVGDLTISALLSGTQNPVVGFLVLSIWENGSYGQIAALGTIVTLICVVAVLLVLWFSGERREGRRPKRRAA